MRPISENTVIQIDITNACHLRCRNCTRHVGHHRRPYYMKPEFFELAVDSILESPCRIGIMGGEPTLHPHFGELMSLFIAKVPIERRELWTAGYAWEDYKDLINDVFLPERIAYNDHTTYDGKHAPLLVAIDDVVKDQELRKLLIENCPYQSHWSASITPKGGFFCEIAASLDYLFDGPGGYDVRDRRWWDKTPAQFQDQVARYCGKCGGAVPFPDYTDGRGGRDGPVPDIVSVSNIQRLTVSRSPKLQAGHVELWEKEIDRAYIEAIAGKNPRAFRSFVAHSKEDVINNCCNRPELCAKP